MKVLLNPSQRTNPMISDTSTAVGDVSRSGRRALFRIQSIHHDLKRGAYHFGASRISWTFTAFQLLLSVARKIGASTGACDAIMDDLPGFVAPASQGHFRLSPGA